MQKVNRKIWFFVAAQILCGFCWVMLSTYASVVFEPIRLLLIGPGLVLEALGVTNQLVLGITTFAVFVMSMLAAVLGFFYFVTTGSYYRRAIGSVGAVMGFGVLVGSVTYLMRPLGELDGIGWVLVIRMVLGVVVYFAIAATIASKAIEWIAGKELSDCDIEIRWVHSVPLCTILPITHLWIGYAQTMSSQFIALGIGSVVLVAYTAWANHSREKSWGYFDSLGYEDLRLPGESRNRANPPDRAAGRQ